MHEASILNDTNFWYAVAVALVVVLLYRTARGPLVKALDNAIAKVVSELEEAKRLRAEAAATLQEYKAKQASALREAEEIVTKAKADAARLREKAQADLKASLERQEQIALERIRIAQEEAAEEVRAFIIDETMHDLRGKLGRHAKSPEVGKIVDDIIAELPKLKVES